MQLTIIVTFLHQEILKVWEEVMLDKILQNILELNFMIKGI